MFQNANARTLIRARATYLGALLGSMRPVIYADCAQTQGPSCPTRAALSSGRAAC